MIISLAAMTALARRAPNASPATQPAIAPIESSFALLAINPGGGKRPRLEAQIAARGHRQGNAASRGHQVQSTSSVTPNRKRP